MTNQEMSLTIVEFKVSLTKFISEMDLPCEVKRMVVAEILTNLSAESNNELKNAIIERERKNDNE